MAATYFIINQHMNVLYNTVYRAKKHFIADIKFIDISKPQIRTAPQGSF